MHFDMSFRVRIDLNNYSKYRMGDLALVKLASPVDFGAWPWVRPACLPTAGQEAAGQELVSVGWDAASPSKIEQVTYLSTI